MTSSLREELQLFISIQMKEKGGAHDYQTHTVTDNYHRGPREIFQSFCVT